MVVVIGSIRNDQRSKLESKNWVVILRMGSVKINWFLIPKRRNRKLGQI